MARPVTLALLATSLASGAYAEDYDPHRHFFHMPVVRPMEAPAQVYGESGGVVRPAYTEPSCEPPDALRCRDPADLNAEGVRLFASDRPEDHARAYALFRAAAERGDLAATYNVGLCHELGKGAPKDFVRMLERYRTAAARGYELAQQALRELLEPAGDDPNRHAFAAYLHGLEGNTQAQRRSWQRAADLGDAGAAWSLAGTFSDRALAERWYARAAAGGITQAFAELEKGADAPGSTAHALLGELYELGRGVAPNSDTAERHYRAAFAAGALDAVFITRLAAIVEHRARSAAERAEAERLYREALARGDRRAEIAALRMALAGKSRAMTAAAARRRLDELVDEGVLVEAFTLAADLELRRGKARRAKAIELLGRAAQRGDDEAAKRLAAFGLEGDAAARAVVAPYLYTHEFEGGAAEGWWTGSNAYVAASFEGGAYVVRHFERKDYLLWRTQPRRDDRWRLATTAKHVAGSDRNYGMGLAITGCSAKAATAFVVADTGHFMVYEVADGTTRRVIDWTRHGAVREGESNALAWSRLGDTWLFEVNGQEVARLPASPMPGPCVGVYIGGVHDAAFERYEVLGTRP